MNRTGDVDSKSRIYNFPNFGDLKKICSSQIKKVNNLAVFFRDFHKKSSQLNDVLTITVKVIKLSNVKFLKPTNKILKQFIDVSSLSSIFVTFKKASKAYEKGLPENKYKLADLLASTVSDVTDFVLFFDKYKVVNLNNSVKSSVIVLKWINSAASVTSLFAKVVISGYKESDKLTSEKSVFNDHLYRTLNLALGTIPLAFEPKKQWILPVGTIISKCMSLKIN